MDLFELIFDYLWEVKLYFSSQRLTPDVYAIGQIQFERHLVDDATTIDRGRELSKYDLRDVLPSNGGGPK